MSKPWGNIPQSKRMKIYYMNFGSESIIFLLQLVSTALSLNVGGHTHFTPSDEWLKCLIKLLKSPSARKEASTCRCIDTRTNWCIPGEFHSVSQLSTMRLRRLPTSCTGTEYTRNFKWPHTTRSVEFRSGLRGAKELVHLYLSSGHGTYDWEISEHRPTAYTERKRNWPTVLIWGLLYTCIRQFWWNLTTNRLEFYTI